MRDHLAHARQVDAAPLSPLVVRPVEGLSRTLGRLVRTERRGKFCLAVVVQSRSDSLRVGSGYHLVTPSALDGPRQLFVPGVVVRGRHHSAAYRVYLGDQNVKVLTAPVGCGAVLSMLPCHDVLGVKCKFGRQPTDQVLELFPADFGGGRHDPVSNAVLPREAQRVRPCVFEIGGVSAHQDDLVVVLPVTNVCQRSLQGAASGPDALGFDDHLPTVRWRAAMARSDTAALLISTAISACSPEDTAHSASKWFAIARM